MKNYILLLIATALFACGCGGKKDKVKVNSKEDFYLTFNKKDVRHLKVNLGGDNYEYKRYVLYRFVCCYKCICI